MERSLVSIVCAIAVTQAHAADLLEIENAGSPNGKYVLEAVATSDDACRVDLKSEADGKIAKGIPVKDFDTHDRRYSISAVWKEDSSAFALNINKGSHTTYCRLFVEHHGSWNEANLPEKQITKLRKEADKEGGKDGAGPEAQFKWPHGVSIDTGANVFVEDRGNHVVRKIKRDGVVSTLAGSPGQF